MLDICAIHIAIHVSIIGLAPEAVLVEDKSSTPRCHKGGLFSLKGASGVHENFVKGNLVSRYDIMILSNLSNDVDLATEEGQEAQVHLKVGISHTQAHVTFGHMQNGPGIESKD